MADEEIREGSPETPRTPPRRDENDDPARPDRRRDADENEEQRDDLGSSPLSALVPVGGSIWALLSLYLAILGCVVPGLPLLALLFGVIALITHESKASYGSITGNIRAVLGILLSLMLSVMQGAILFVYLTNPNVFR